MVRPWVSPKCQNKWLANDLTLSVRYRGDRNYDLAFYTTVRRPFLCGWKGCQPVVVFKSVKNLPFPVCLRYGRVREKVCKLIKQEIENSRLDIKSREREKIYCACRCTGSTVDSKNLFSLFFFRGTRSEEFRTCSVAFGGNTTHKYLKGQRPLPWRNHINAYLFWLYLPILLLLLLLLKLLLLLRILLPLLLLILLLLLLLPLTIIIANVLIHWIN